MYMRKRGEGWIVLSIDAVAIRRVNKREKESQVLLLDELLRCVC
jgi:hypothetical protein